MPLNQKQHADVNWGLYAVQHGWPSVHDPKSLYRMVAIRHSAVPYGSYVTYEEYTYVETQEMMDKLKAKYAEVYANAKDLEQL
jgi:3D (Asp-Asp-Asp) domain-containing protein